MLSLSTCALWLAVSLMLTMSELLNILRYREQLKMWCHLVRPVTLNISGAVNICEEFSCNLHAKFDDQKLNTDNTKSSMRLQPLKYDEGLPLSWSHL